jgi:NADH dehydrogenase/NADH:ubiquinone oxidoreductase subunit G
VEKKVIINDRKYKLEEKNDKYVIYQYCYYKGIELPCFCYNENLEIAGNCRICLVEINTTPKLVLACATTIEKNMIIKTNTKRIKRVRQSIIEFLLINHPLDCPICDQGGECDLQNITQIYGLDRGRFYEFAKRSVLDKESGFFIKTIMTRCIHCTRCIRFFKEIEGKVGFGFVGRGEETEIVTKKENLLSILSGNVVDICPVGALTSKIYTFTARPWELNKYENIDILDTMCSTICIDLRNNKILRILPATDSFLNND